MTFVTPGRRVIALSIGAMVLLSAVIFLASNRNEDPRSVSALSTATTETTSTVTESTEAPTTTAPTSTLPTTTAATARPTTTARPQLALPADVKLLAIGDSITADAGWRQSLYQQLTATTGRTWSFVGSQNDGGVSGRHEGHSGWVNEQLAAQATAWVSRTKPDIVLIHGGTNDIWTGSSGADAANELSDVISNVYAGKADTHVIVAGIIPLFANGTNNALSDYETRIPSVVKGFSNQGRSIQYVDMSRLLVESDTRDGIHPNESGKSKMADAWYRAVNQYVSGK